MAEPLSVPGCGAERWPSAVPGPRHPDDLESGCPPEFADVSVHHLFDQVDAARQERAAAAAGECVAAGFLPRASQPPPRFGSGFESGGVLDTSAPGGSLAGLTDAATRDGGLAELSDDELIGVLQAWRRLESWCSAGTLAAIAELARRRPAEGRAPAPSGAFPAELSEFIGDEVAAALTISGRTASSYLDLALDLATRLPGTAAALRAGRIDYSRARLVADATRVLTDEQAHAVETRVLASAGQQTTGQLRASVSRAVLAADPEAAAGRREQAQRDPSVRRWREDAGTAALAGFGLPPADVLAADQQLTDRAARLRDAGVEGSLEQLRARAYLDALLDRDSAPARDATEPGQHPSLAGHRSLTAQLNLTLPLATLLAAGNGPGDVAGFGPVDPALARVLADGAVADPATRWCVTITGEGDRAVAHGCGRGQPPGAPTAFGGSRPFTLTVSPLARYQCDHRHQEPGYEPSRRLRHLVIARDPTCTAAGCRRAATRCDLDHTVPYDQGGRTCECDLAPLCRHHHRCKQSEGWRLEQPQPGVLRWTTPAGRRYLRTPGSAPR